MVKIAIVYYSLKGHIAANAQEILKGLRSVGADADVFQLPETLSPEVLEKMNAPPKDTSIPEIKINQLTEYDAFLFGIPTRYGNFPAQWKAFIDQGGALWAGGALHGKLYGLFFSTATPGGGQEMTASNALSTFVHLGMVYVPLGYGEAKPLLANLKEVHGGSPWGAGSFADLDGSRKSSELEKELHRLQGRLFYEVIQKIKAM